MDLLGHALARRAGTDYEELFRSRIARPLGMKSTAITLSPEMQARLAPGHYGEFAKVPSLNPALAGAGMLRSSANDMLTFLAAQLGFAKTPLAPAIKYALAPRRPNENSGGRLEWSIARQDGRNIVWHSGPGGHGIRQPSREAIDAWMNRYLKDQPGPTASEPQCVVEFDEELNSTPTGQVATSLGGETASTLQIKAAKQLEISRKPDRDLRAAVLKLTKFEKPSGELAIVSEGTVGRPGYDIERLVYESEPGLKVPALLFVPPTNIRKNSR